MRDTEQSCRKSRDHYHHQLLRHTEMQEQQVNHMAPRVSLRSDIANAGTGALTGTPRR